MDWRPMTTHGPDHCMVETDDGRYGEACRDAAGTWWWAGSEWTLEAPITPVRWHDLPQGWRDTGGEA